LFRGKGWGGSFFGIFVEEERRHMGDVEERKMWGVGKWEKKEDLGRPFFRCLQAYAECESEISGEIQIDLVHGPFFR